MIVVNKASSVLIVGLLVALALPTPALAQRGKDKDKDDEKEKDPKSVVETDENLYKCGKAKGRFRINFKPDVELDELVDWAMGFSCKSFIYATGIGGRSAKVTMKTPKDLSSRQAWGLFLSALRAMNLTVVPAGSVLEIVEQPQAKRKALPIYNKGRPANNAQVVRAVIRPRHLPVADLAAVLTELKSKDGEVKAIEKAGIIVVTDFGSHIAKMTSLMASVDRPVVGGERLYMIKVHHADASELATKLQEILGVREAAATPAPTARSKRRNRRNKDDAKKSKPDARAASRAVLESALPSKIIADERSNSLILLATEPAYLRVKALVKRLDIGSDIEGGGRIHVYLLDNADAEEMAATLMTVISGIQSQSSGQSGNRTTRQPVRPATGASIGSAAFEGQVRVSADKPTNSLVIVASVGDFLSLREVIRKLDTPRLQVYIEATIVEVGVDNGLDLGVSFHGGAEFGDGNLLIGGVQHSDLSSLNVASLATARGLIGGALGSLLPGSETLLGQSIPSFGVLFQALATNSNVNVLSSPHILTTDNEEAEISVGENIPYQGAISGLGGAGGQGASFFPTQSIQRQDVALTLKITPQINASNMVRLAIDLEISDIASEDFQGLGPSWSKRTIKDVVVVHDQQAVIIGGLISDRVTHTESKVPLLGDIPILGYFFKYSQKRKVKRNLLVLLTPYIVKNQMDIEQIVERRVREQREFIRSFANFKRIKYRTNTDYRRKRGVVEEINRSLIRVEKDAELLRELDRKRVEHPDGPIEYFEEDEEGDDDGSAGEDGDAALYKVEPSSAEATPADDESPDGAASGGKEAK